MWLRIPASLLIRISTPFKALQTSRSHLPRKHAAAIRQRPLSDSHHQQMISLPSPEKEGTCPGPRGALWWRRPTPWFHQQDFRRQPARRAKERGSRPKAVSAPSSRSKDFFADTDRGDVVALALLTFLQPRHQTSRQAKERLTLCLL